MRFWKLIWVTAGTATLFVGRYAAATEIGWGLCWYNPVITWYAPNSPYPYYFGPPYPCTSYLPSFYATPPFMTGLAVKEQLIHMGVYPVPPPKETLPPPIPEGKKPEEAPPPKPEGKKPEEAPPPKPEGKEPKFELPPVK